MITTNLTGNLGNHMWQYAVCRHVAEKKGFEWGINSKPSYDYHNGMNQMYFMEVDFGKPVQGITKEFHEKWTFYQADKEHVNVTMMDSNVWNIEDNSIMLGRDGAAGGFYQSEKYFSGHYDKIKSWFKIKNEYEKEYQKKLSELNIKLDENLCIINFRGGEYRGIPNVLCRKEYWRDSINHMLVLNPQMKFIVITDDPTLAKTFMPFDIPCHHIDIGFDFYCVNKAKWLIISNSTFGWWSSWLNEDVNKILAPKYFGSHNLSDGYWCVGEIYTEKFFYVNREGNLADYESCKKEAELYYKTKKIF